MNIAPVEDLTPLTPQVAGILLVLAQRPLYGYAIKQQVQKDLNITMSMGSLYPSLSRLEQMKFISSVGMEAGTSSPNKRKVYKITNTGRYVLGLETERLSQFVGLARSYNKGR